MAAFSNYAGLRLALSEHVSHRNIASVLPRLVQMAESSLNRQLRTRYQITTDTLTFTDGSAALPDDFLEMVSVYGLNGFQYRSGPIADSQESGTMLYRYTVDGSNILINGYSGDRDIVYFAALPSLLNSPNTNWLLSTYPEVYLYAIGLEAARHLKDPELVAFSENELAKALKSVKIDDDRARWANTTVRVAGLTP
jgi:hypothetical protein